MAELRPWQILAGLGAVIGFMATTRPDAAASSIGAWLSLLGIANATTISGRWDAIAIVLAVVCFVGALTYGIMRRFGKTIWTTTESVLGPLGRRAKMVVALLLLCLGTVIAAIGGVMFS